MLVTAVEQSRDAAMGGAIARATSALGESRDVCRRLPVGSEDAGLLHHFLAGFCGRVKDMRAGACVMAPFSWLDEKNQDRLVVLVVSRGEGDEFSAAIVNTCSDAGQGLGYHPSSADPTHGHVMTQLTLEMNHIPESRASNATFWFLFFRSAVFPKTCNGSAQLLYERVIPFLPLMPVHQAQQVPSRTGPIFDLEPVPPRDRSMVHCVMECVRYICRKSGLSQAQAKHVTALVKTGLLKIALNDLYASPQPPALHELQLVKLAAVETANAVGVQAEGEGGCTAQPAHVHLALSVVRAVKDRVWQLDEHAFPLPLFSDPMDEALEGICAWAQFGRLRRDMSVENLAGEAEVPPIMRPIEMTLVPDRASTFHEVQLAMRHCLNLCVLLSNQRKLVRNSYTLRLCLIEHLFVRVIPLPLPVTHPERDTLCFWHAQPLRYDAQADVMRLLNMLCRHFATASLSVKTTRSGDAVRMLVFACMGTLCDAAMRKTAYDIPSFSSLHYAGTAEGPVKPFGFDLGNFAEESEYLKFSTPETSAARTQVLDYFHQLKKHVPPENWIFRFQDGMQCGDADKRFLDQLCVQMGFERNCEAIYITGANMLVLDHYPEIGFFRDLVFMFKLVMLPTSDKLPAL
ncbi:hypothetical protein B484DRAFT_278952, partial [Ochromonadaceae sp. CCMP2298]